MLIPGVDVNVKRLTICLADLIVLGRADSAKTCLNAFHTLSTQAKRMLIVLNGSFNR